jgi:rhodanese-related sulfurtransferase
VIDKMLLEARGRITRYSPHEASESGHLLVDTRSSDERRRDGVIPGSVHAPLSVLEWRADQTCEHANPELGSRRLIIVCTHGYSSSLAADRLVSLGIDAGDLDGGFEAWRDAGLPVVDAPDEQ